MRSEGRKRAAGRGGARGPHGGRPAGAGVSGGPMGKYCASLSVLKGPWDQVFAAFWQRYPNPYRCAGALRDPPAPFRQPGPIWDWCHSLSSSQPFPRGSRGLYPSGMGVLHHQCPAGIWFLPALILQFRAIPSPRGRVGEDQGLMFSSPF